MEKKTLNIRGVMAFCLGALLISGVGLAQAMTFNECVSAVQAGLEPGLCYDVFQIHAVRVAGFDIHGGPATDPSHAYWAGSPVTTVYLPWRIRMDVNTPPPQIENSFMNLAKPDMKSRVLQVQAIHDGVSIVYKIFFKDATQDDSIADVPLFHDALAIGMQYDWRTDALYNPCFAANDQPDMMHMGFPYPGDPVHAFCPVQLMFWRADAMEIENILANGPGTTIESYETDTGILNTFQSWGNGIWTVLLARPMIDPFPPYDSIFPGPNMVTLATGSYDIIFANWNGSIQERNGYKYIAPWGTLIIEP